MTAPRKADRKRWRRQIVLHLEEFPRQFAALETAMAAFGDDFELRRFKEAFVTQDDMDAYNDVQALERAIGRVQNFVADLAISGARFADLAHSPMNATGSAAQRAFEALRDAQVIDAALCKRLTRAQKARSFIEHGYVQAKAGDVHRAATLVHETAHSFIGPYRSWIAGYLREG